MATAITINPTRAQDVDPADEIEEIVVTGSYLYTGLDSPSPVAVIPGEDLIEFAPTDLNEFFFDNVTQNFGSETITQTFEHRYGREADEV